MVIGRVAQIQPTRSERRLERESIQLLILRAKCFWVKCPEKYPGTNPRESHPNISSQLIVVSSDPGSFAQQDQRGLESHPFTLSIIPPQPLFGELQIPAERAITAAAIVDLVVVAGPDFAFHIGKIPRNQRPRTGMNRCGANFAVEPSGVGIVEKPI